MNEDIDEIIKLKKAVDSSHKHKNSLRAVVKRKQQRNPDYNDYEAMMTTDMKRHLKFKSNEQFSIPVLKAVKM